MNGHLIELMRLHFWIDKQCKLQSLIFAFISFNEGRFKMLLNIYANISCKHLFVNYQNIWLYESLFHSLLRFISNSMNNVVAMRKSFIIIYLCIYLAILCRVVFKQQTRINEIRQQKPCLCYICNTY